MLMRGVRGNRGDGDRAECRVQISQVVALPTASARRGACWLAMLHPALSVVGLLVGVFWPLRTSARAAESQRRVGPFGSFLRLERVIRVDRVREPVPAGAVDAFGPHSLALGLVLIHVCCPAGRGGSAVLG